MAPTDAPHALIISGGGRIGGAFLAGLVSSNRWRPEDLWVVEPDSARRMDLVADRPGLHTVSNPAELDPSVVAGASGAVLAVKPAIAEQACRSLGAVGVRRVLSVAAGIPAGRLEAALPEGSVVVRAMPNLAAVVGASVTAVCGGSAATAADLSWAQDVVGTLGAVVRVPEHQLDAVTGLSGSGPAYLFLVVEALVEAGVLTGLSRELATTLAAETLRGAAALLATGLAPEELRAQVTSPGGTTAAGLRALEARGVRSAFIEAVVAAVERARSLSR